MVLDPSVNFTIDLSQYPTLSGVYLMKDAQGAILYVGKAKNLRARLRTYFVAGGDGRVHIQFLLEKVRHVDTIITDTEKEALILENTLIKKHRPRYNIDLRDDKTYVSLRLDRRERFPGLQVVRQVRPAPSVHYFGPFASASGVRETLKQIYRIFPLRHYPEKSCQKRGRPCLFHQIGQCSAPCHGKISEADYNSLVDGVIDLLSGREEKVLESLRLQMQEASESMAFERAARLRDQIRAIESTLESQKVVEAGGGDLDVVGIHREGGEVEIALLFIRQGKLIDRRTYGLEWRLDEDQLLAGFLQEFYGRDVLIPGQVLLPFVPESQDSIADWMSDRRGRKARLVVPQRGEKLRLVRLAARNAREAFRQRGAKKEAQRSVLEEIQQKLHLSRLPKRMECFDISTVQGSQTVGSMTVMVDGETTPAEYRRYRIQSVSGQDDFASMQEVLSRRLRDGEQSESLPDLILVDGGKGQLGAVDLILRELALQDRIDLAGIAKSRVKKNVKGKAVEKTEERFFRPGRANPVTLRQGSAPLFVLQHLRDEAHRFAITYHRKLRSKAHLKSALEDIPGVGPGRRKKLLSHFGSLKRLRAASLEDLIAVPGIPEKVARDLFEYFRQRTAPES